MLSPELVLVKFDYKLRFHTTIAKLEYGIIWVTTWTTKRKPVFFFVVHGYDNLKHFNFCQLINIA